MATGNNKSGIDVPPLKEPENIEVHYIKGNFFRVIHADGAWGGITPSGYLQMSLYNQRTPIPRHALLPVLDDTVAGAEVVKEGKVGIVREFEVEAIMSLEVAESLRNWLDDKIAALREIRRAEAAEFIAKFDAKKDK